jgi:hypothetical protein
MSDLFSSLNISNPSSSPQVGATDLESTPPVAPGAPKGEFNQLSLGISDTVGGGGLKGLLKDLQSLFRIRLVSVWDPRSLRF